MLRRLLFLIVAASLTLTGCSLLDSPELPPGEGTIRLHFEGGGPASAAGPSSLAAALPTADSVVVKVFRAGAGTVLEKVKGARLNPPTDSVTIALSVIAENGKRVSVQLYESGLMRFFGVNENVNVVSGAHTSVSIAATTFGVGGVWKESYIGDGVAFGLVWASTPAAVSYRVQRSAQADFATVDWESIVQDTFVVTTLGAGDYFYRIAAENPYAISEYKELPLHVYGPPVISSIDAPEVMRGETAQMTVYGEDLDYSLSTQVTVFGSTANVVTAAAGSLVVDIQPPADALSDVVRVTTDLGSDSSAAVVPVQTIAYVLGSVVGGDWTSAGDYKAMIDAYGAGIFNSRVKVIPYDFIDLIDLSVFELVVVGWDTGTTQADWGGGVKTRADAIVNSGANVLAMGLGGAAFLDAATLDIGLSSTVTSTQTTASVINETAVIYVTPNNMGVVNGQVLSLYAAGTPTVYSMIQGGPLPFGVSFFATRAPQVLAFPLVQQTSTNGPGLVTNFLWGFHASPRTLDTEGVFLFENVVHYLFNDAIQDIVPVN